MTRGMSQEVQQTGRNSYHLDIESLQKEIRKLWNSLQLKKSGDEAVKSNALSFNVTLHLSYDPPTDVVFTTGVTQDTYYAASGNSPVSPTVNPVYADPVTDLPFRDGDEIVRAVGASVKHSGLYSITVSTQTDPFAVLGDIGGGVVIPYTIVVISAGTDSSRGVVYDPYQTGVLSGSVSLFDETHIPDSNVHLLALSTGDVVLVYWAARYPELNDGTGGDTSHNSVYFHVPGATRFGLPSGGGDTPVDLSLAISFSYLLRGPGGKYGLQEGPIA